MQDYQKLNEQTIRNIYALPRINNFIENLGEFDKFCKFDI